MNHIYTDTNGKASYQITSAIEYEGKLLITLTCTPLMTSTVLPMDQALMLADLIYSIAKPEADIQRDMLADAIKERKAA